MDLRRLDLNLLRVFDTVMQERSVTRAAQRLFLTQSAVSSALGRLREQLGDELFLRGPGKLRPTPRALELEAPVRTLLAELAQLLSPPRFEPATERRRFTIATNDYFSAVVLPPLAARLARLAPGVDLHIVPTGGRALELLDQREADFVATGWGALPERFERCTLLRDRYACLVRKDHPFARKAPTLAQFAAAKHVLVSPRGDAHGFIDDKLAEKGLTRRIAFTLNHFAAAPQLVAETDCVLTVLGLIAERFAPPRRTVLIPCPLPAPPTMTRMDLIWHDRLSRHPAPQWLREQLQIVGAQLSPAPASPAKNPAPP